MRLLTLAERDAFARAEEASTLRGRADECDRLAAALRAAEAERDALLTSTSWRLTAPLRTLAARLARARAPDRRRVLADDSAAGAAGAPPPSTDTRTTEPATLPVAYPEPCPPGSPRVTLLLERLAIGDASERVALPVALALTIARQTAARLRVLTRVAPADPAALDALLTDYGLTCPGNPGFDRLAPAGSGPGLGVCAGERAVVGQRRNAWLASGMFAPERVVYCIDQAEVAHLTATAGDRRTRALFADSRPTLVFASAAVAAALHRSGLLPRAGAEAPTTMLTLPDQPWTPGWHGAIDRFVVAWLQA